MKKSISLLVLMIMISIFNASEVAAQTTLINLTPTGDMESSNLGFTVSNSNCSSISYVTETELFGSANKVLNYVNSGGYSVLGLQGSAALSASHNYYYKFNVKSQSTNINCWSNSLSKSLGVATTEWQTFSGTFTGVTSLGLFSAGNSACSLYLDNIEIYDITSAYMVTKSDEHSSINIISGVMNIDGNVMANAGDRVSFTVTVDNGYKISSVMYSETEITPNNGIYTFIMPSDNAVIIVNTQFITGFKSMSYWSNLIINSDMQNISDISMFFDGNSNQNISYASDAELSSRNNVLRLLPTWIAQPVGQIIELQPGKTYYMCAQVKSDGVQNVRFAAWYTNASEYSLINEFAMQANTWQKLEATFTAPSDTGMNQSLRIIPQSLVGIYIDNWYVVELTEPMQNKSTELYLNYGQTNQIMLQTGSYTNGAVTGVITGINNIRPERHVNAIIAKFAGGMLIECYNIQITLPSMLKNATLVVGQIDTEAGENRTIKVFLWDANTNDSLMNVYVYNTVIYDQNNSSERQWTPVMMVNQTMHNAGIMGGEGGQREMSLAIDPTGYFLLAGTDVGGLLRSIDGGTTWEHANRGFKALGGFGFAIDPVNTNRVICVGSSYIDTNAANGLYLSTNKGYSWSQVLSQPGAAMGRDFRESVTFDPTSYNSTIGGCAIAYWSRPWKRQHAPSMNGINNPSSIVVNSNDSKGLWKTTDGGQTWNVVNQNMSDGIVKVNPSNGTVYVANLDGFFRSVNGGATFTQVLSGRIIYGMDVVASKPNYVYINDTTGVWVSSDSGATFSKAFCFSGYPQSSSTTDPNFMVRSLKVSPVNTNYMMLSSMSGGNYQSKKYYTSNGGLTWSQSSYNETNDFFKCNNRESVFVWHPTNSSKVWSFGGDWIASSGNNGQTFIWDYNGGNAVHIDQRSSFNIYNPNILYFGSQDNHGALTTDGGTVWKHVWKFTDSHFAGFVYGSYAVDQNTLIALVAQNSGGQTEICVSRDAGETWMHTGILITDNSHKKWSEQCYQSPENPNILFAANYRSIDNGYTWTKMSNCNAVYCHNPYGNKEIYGSYRGKIMVSNDDGATWQEYASVKVPAELATMPQNTEIWDMSYDGINKIMYYVSGTGTSGRYFCKIQNGTTTDLSSNRNPLGSSPIQLCAVDPRYPNVVYLGGYGCISPNSNGVQRSVDGGNTFQTLTANTEGNSIVTSGTYGGWEPYDIMVNPVNGDLWVAQSCHGWVKFDPPYQE